MYSGDEPDDSTPHTQYRSRQESDSDQNNGDSSSESSSEAQPLPPPAAGAPPSTCSAHLGVHLGVIGE